MKQFLVAAPVLVFGLPLGVVPAACVDTKPVHLQQDGSLLPNDAAGESDAPSPCLQCLTAPDDPGPGCGDEWQACMANELCAKVFLCVWDTGCFYSVTPADRVKCGLPCAQREGLLDPRDPAMSLAYGFQNCADKCQSACGGGG